MLKHHPRITQKYCNIFSNELNIQENIYTHRKHTVRKCCVPMSTFVSYGGSVRKFRQVGGPQASICTPIIQTYYWDLHRSILFDFNARNVTDCSNTCHSWNYI